MDDRTHYPFAEEVTGEPFEATTVPVAETFSRALARASEEAEREVVRRALGAMAEEEAPTERFDRRAVKLALARLERRVPPPPAAPATDLGGFLAAREAAALREESAALREESAQTGSAALREASAQAGSGVDAEEPIIPLVRRKGAEWIDGLPDAARRVLEDARELQPSWPLRERLPGSVARPRQRIPSLRPRQR
ncbi:MAG TPA: hypothetical protein RMH85_06280 [Polyangiaceae bacterium LLY-WYZ-15_(1-7)]|nr:hypothetical protein [Polyangiaceae bacterium LLY-WYZ-15_(1-7)]HJL03137.1 hypothetical protein [Polyangiaceae bacterium LLY-WYZ-15_(1-7)]HJL08083.1 hypothetical protein [Polyangiaceae bacterium LLY-WYZ-15_(1-7)]HJL23310.1 hypothetical protein [Polyangiaceae bacterium LLY-WYZ-15_(1-7)]HJL29881.1 hypothetical protein [Polyangiaceae bacterium LLY-WYZ-15_(1-7)]